MPPCEVTISTELDGVLYDGVLDETNSLSEIELTVWPDSVTVGMDQVAGAR
jgi:hypothetical protein